LLLQFEFLLYGSQLNPTHCNQLPSAIPCIVGCHNATGKIKTGQMITVDTSSGDEGLIYDGEVEYEVYI
jgi:hypothetical protein